MWAEFTLIVIDGVGVWAELVLPVITGGLDVGGVYPNSEWQSWCVVCPSTK